jgi:hypothetical protein
MTDRRAFIQSGVSLVALAALPLPIALASFGGPSFAGSLDERSLVVVDRNLPASAVLAAEAAAADCRVLGFDNDIARLWMSEIEPRLRAGPLTLVGHTSAATLFCLELLAQDYGAQVVRRVTEMRGVSWLIATSPARRAALVPVAQIAPRS